MTLASRGGKFDGSAGGENHQTLAVESGWHRVVICDNTYALDGDTFRFELGAAGGGRVLVAPVQSACVRVDPEETSMAVI